MSINLLIQIIILATFTINLSHGASQYCQTVNGINPNACDTCQVGYYPQQDNSNCQNNISNCILYSGNNCVQCSGSFGVLNNICSDKIQNCAVYQNNSICKTCHTLSGYELNIDGSSCFNTIPNCQQYKSGTQCQQCKTNYSLSFDSSTCYIAPTSDCYKVDQTDKYSCSSCNNSFYLTYQNTCQKCNVDHCSSCRSDGMCSICINNAYTQVNGICVCSPGYYSEYDYNTSKANSYICVQCQNKCSTCQSYSQCTSCKNNRKIEYNCDCPPGYVEDQQSGECQRCEYGSYLYGKVCLKQCPKGFYQNQKTRSCQPCENIYKNNSQCSNIVQAKVYYETPQTLTIQFSEEIKVKDQNINLNNCLNAYIFSNQNSESDQQISFKNEGSKFSIKIEGQNTYSETELVFENIEPGCFLDQDGSFINYPINIQPKNIIVSPKEDMLYSEEIYNKGIILTVFVIGALILILSFIGIKLISSLMVETMQIIFCLYFVDVYIPYQLDSLFRAIDIFNFRIITYFMSGFSGVNFKRDNDLFGYELRDQELQGRFFQRGNFVNSFFYNGLTYVFLITFFYLIYLLLSNTCLAPYPYPLALKRKDIESEKQNKTEDQNISQKMNFIPKSPVNKLEPVTPVLTPQVGMLTHQNGSLSFQNRYSIPLQVEEKIYEANKYEKQIFYLLQLVLHMTKISYIPLTFAAGLQIKSYSQADNVNTFGFFCSILTLCFLVFSCCLLLYRDINKMANNFQVIKQNEDRYIYQVSEIKISNHKSQMSKMENLCVFYPLVQTFCFALSVLLITWLDRCTDILLYILIVIYVFLLCISLYSPFVSSLSNRYNAICIMFILSLLFGLLIIDQLNKQIVQKNGSSNKEKLFKGINSVTIVFVGLILIFIISSLIYKIYMTYSLFKNLNKQSDVMNSKENNSKNSFIFVSQVRTVYPAPIKSQIYGTDSYIKDDRLAVKDLENVDMNKNNKPSVLQYEEYKLSDKKKSIPEIISPQKKRLSLLQQMQVQSQNNIGKQVFVAPRKSVQKLASNPESQASINEQISTNPSSIQIIEFEELSKLVKENKKMGKKLNQIEKQQQSLLKKINKKTSLQNIIQSSSSSESSSESDGEVDNDQMKKSPNQSIETIKEEDESMRQQSEISSKRKRQSLQIEQLTQTPPSLQRIKKMDQEVFHLKNDIKAEKMDDSSKQLNISNKRKKVKPFTQKTRKVKTALMMEEDKTQLFIYNEEDQQSNQADYKNKQRNKLPSPQQSNEILSSDEDNDQNFWKYSRKNHLKQNQKNRTQSMVYN